MDNIIIYQTMFISLLGAHFFIKHQSYPRILFLLAGCVVYEKAKPYLLSHGPAVDIPSQHQPSVSSIDMNNVSLRLSSGKLTKIYERGIYERTDLDALAKSFGIEKSRKNKPLLTLPETILFDNNGIMYIMNENAKLISLTDFQPTKDEHILTAKTTEVADLGMGRPLGGKFDKNGCLYFADSLLGLARICNVQQQQSTNGTSIDNRKSNVELVASRVKLDDGSWSPINYADDVDIGPQTGHVYFSDASDVKSDRDSNGMWDIEYSSKIEGIRGKRTGRLLRYKPETGEVDVLATNAAFANGVAIDKDETYVLYTSTFEACVMKYHLKGEKEGTAERLPLNNAFPGFLDGADCSFESGLCYVAVPTPMSELVRTIFSLPPWLGKRIRTLLLMIPRSWAPKAKPFGAVAEIFPGDDEKGMSAGVVRIFQDPDGRDMSMVTGVTVHDGKVYLGSLHNNHVGVLILDAYL